ncbi:putative nucleotidyltransferase with HDIG domain [Lewinella marina]|uniref:tRNA nucleotidyltransferase n=1 Tax=Neolewinella marina TaxID=438751 RepID=A0A2G0CCU2_9BACT|nr:HD domain-containing protein [Neolewinella marina]NJB87012.1 putative nucleotidyltransferase with HDIG domain [Neolewinella marina]PHK97796.1 tRNA nucleotidyltransferase [Neolewinella marina]
MIFQIREDERKIFEVIGQAAAALGFPTYVVGGYVRDRLLGRPSKDLDIVCVGSGIELARRVADNLHPRSRVTVYKRFGTAALKHHDMEIEFVGARKESYRSDSRKPTVESGTLTDDQNRRDFTINALAISLNDHDYGSIIDPFNGLEDLEAKRIVTPLEPGKTFSDDPLRMLRAIRFSNQLGFRIDPVTFRAIKENRERIKIISWERIATELNKILLTAKPSIGLRLLDESGLLPYILPELAALRGVESRNGRKHKDNFIHTTKVVDNLAERSDDLWLRWAALLHDIGKARTKRWEPEAGWTFHAHDAVGERMVPKIFRRLRLPNDRLKYVQKLVALHQRPISLTQEEISDSAVRRILFDAAEDIEDLMTLCESDITSKNAKKVQRYLENYEQLRERMREIEEKDHLRNWQPPISGELIMETFGIPPSREVGAIKDSVREAILDGDIPNEYEAAYAKMLEVAAGMSLQPVRE